MSRTNRRHSSLSEVMADKVEAKFNSLEDKRKYFLDSGKDPNSLISNQSSALSKDVIDPEDDEIMKDSFEDIRNSSRYRINSVAPFTVPKDSISSNAGSGHHNDYNNSIRSTQMSMANPRLSYRRGSSLPQDFQAGYNNRQSLVYNTADRGANSVMMDNYELSHRDTTQTSLPKKHTETGGTHTEIGNRQTNMPMSMILPQMPQIHLPDNVTEGVNSVRNSFQHNSVAWRTTLSKKWQQIRDPIVSGVKSTKKRTSHITSGPSISLQIQQWKTVADFESDEQAKFLIFSELKSVSKKLFWLSIFTVICAMLDVEMIHFSKLVDKETALDFLTPKCWPMYVEQPTFIIGHSWYSLNFLSNVSVLGSAGAIPKPGILTNDEVITHLGSLFNATNNTHVMTLLEDKVKYGDINSILNEAITPWLYRRSQINFYPPEPYLSIIVILRSLITIFSVTLVVYLWNYYNVILRLYTTKKRLPEGSKLRQVPLFKTFFYKSIFCLLHIPPLTHRTFFNLSEYPYQWINLFKLPVIVLLYWREHHPMRYNRMTEILCTLSSVKLSSKFLIKTPFLRTPLMMIMSTYLLCVFGVTYLVYIFERQNAGNCNSFYNSLWLSMVTSTNLGFGDFLVGNYISKIILMICSIVGIMEMALLVNYVSDFMSIPPDEKRILGFYNKHEKVRELRIAAANLIKARFKLYKYKCKVSDCFAARMELDTTDSYTSSGRDAEAGRASVLDKKRAKKGHNFERTFKRTLNDSRKYEITYQDYYRAWLKVKADAEAIQHQLSKGFLVDDTAIAATYITRKLEDLETTINENHLNSNNPQIVSRNTELHTTGIDYLSNSRSAANSRASQMGYARSPDIHAARADKHPVSQKAKLLEKEIDSIQNKKRWISASQTAARKTTTFNAHASPNNLGTSTSRIGESISIFDNLVKQMRKDRFGKEAEKNKQTLEIKANELRAQLEEALMTSTRSNSDSMVRDSTNSGTTVDSPYNEIGEANDRIKLLEELMLKMSDNIKMLTQTITEQGSAPTPQSPHLDLEQITEEPENLTTSSPSSLSQTTHVARRRGGV